MSFSLYSTASGTFTGMLTSLGNVLDKGVEHAATQEWDAGKLPNARLAPDMFPLTKQVQIACDHAKNAMARLGGLEPPVFSDDEQTLDALKDRIAQVLTFIESVPESGFAGAEERQYVIPLFGDYVLDTSGEKLLRDWHFPHFYFHVVTAYDILRQAGVPIGKQDYIGHIAGSIRQKTTDA